MTRAIITRGIKYPKLVLKKFRYTLHRYITKTLKKPSKKPAQYCDRGMSRENSAMVAPEINDFFFKYPLFTDKEGAHLQLAIGAEALTQNEGCFDVTKCVTTNAKVFYR